MLGADRNNVTDPNRRKSAMKALPRSWRGIAAAMLWLLAAAIAPAEPRPPPALRSDVIYVIAGGWHTELALPLAVIDPPLTALAARFPDTRYLVFGWGARGYYMARHPGFSELIRAATPGPAVMLVIPLATSPADFAGPANTIGVAISPAGAARLSRLLWSDLLPDQARVPDYLGPGPELGSMFFAAAGTYDLSHTCNSWTAEILRAAGVPVSAEGVVFAGQLLGQLRQSR
jgi:Protein of unknown function (DUF2459)